jgi:hypothetical protein
MPRLDGRVNLQGKWHLYPDRQRCLACRRFFGFTVIDRLYCSYLCAGVKPPGDDPNEAPRKCVTGSIGSRRFKVRYQYLKQVPSFQLRKKNTDAYYCDYCHHYHIGHRRVRNLI